LHFYSAAILLMYVFGAPLRTLLSLYFSNSAS